MLAFIWPVGIRVLVLKCRQVAVSSCKKTPNLNQMRGKNPDSSTKPPHLDSAEAEADTKAVELEGCLPSYFQGLDLNLLLRLESLCGSRHNNSTVAQTPDSHLFFGERLRLEIT